MEILVKLNITITKNTLEQRYIFRTKLDFSPTDIEPTGISLRDISLKKKFADRHTERFFASKNKVKIKLFLESLHNMETYAGFVTEERVPKFVLVVGSLINLLT